MAQRTHWYQSSTVLWIVSVIASAIIVGTTYNFQHLKHKFLQYESKPYTYTYVPKAAQGYVALTDSFDVQVMCEGSKHARGRLEKKSRHRIHFSDANGQPFSTSDTVELDAPRAKGLRCHIMAPQSVEVEIAALKQIEVTVHPTTQGTPARGYLLGDVRAIPSKVNLRVPQSNVNAEISTVPISILNRDAGFDKKVQLQLPPHASLVRTADRTVKVHIDIMPERKTVLLDPIKVEIQDPPRGYTVRAVPDYVSVQVRVGVDTKEIKKVRARVDAGQLPTDDEGHIITGTSKGYEPEISGVPKWAELVGFKPAALQLVVDKNEAHHRGQDR